MIEWDKAGPHLTIKDQAELLSLNRTALYRTGKRIDEREVEIKHIIDRLHTAHPYKGSRSIVDDIEAMDNIPYAVNRKRVQRYMREMGIQAIHPGPNLSKRNRQQYVYPYLLRNLKPSRPNHAWAIDVTYVPMRGRWMYLVGIIDWYSRMIVGYELSDTLAKGFILQTVERAIAVHGAPDILNSDQGSQFTSPAYVEILKKNSIQISMDGKGRALDNIIIERFWRTIKYWDIYIHEYDTPRALHRGVDQFMNWYNFSHRHTGIGKKRPAEVYYGVPLPQLTVAQDSRCLEGTASEPSKVLNDGAAEAILSKPSSVSNVSSSRE